MGASLTATGGRLPLAIEGGDLSGIDYTLPVASAQVKSAILLAGLGASGQTTVHEPAPTRDHTELMLEAAGAKVTRRPGSVTVAPGGALRLPDVLVPGDISSAAPFMVAAALLPGSTLTVHDVGLNPRRTGILDVLERMGARVGVLGKRRIAGELIGDVEIGSQPLVATRIEAVEVPRLVDELPLVALLGAFARGTTEVTGAEELRAKESDRIETVTRAMQAVGVRIQARPDGFSVRGHARPSARRLGRRRRRPPDRDARGGRRRRLARRRAARRRRIGGGKLPGFFELLGDLARSSDGAGEQATR